MADANMKLTDRTRVGVIGGGPAGSFFAYLLLRETQRRGIPVSVTIFDGKDFERTGRQGCNMCAGTLSSHLIKQLKMEGYSFPARIVQRYIRGYVIHSPKYYAQLDQSEGEVIYTVFRGIPFPELASERGSFDQFLLDVAMEHGAQYVRGDVCRIGLPRSSQGSVTVDLAPPADKAAEVDLVVGAFGVKTHPVRILPFGYMAPRVWRAFQGELAAPREFITDRYGDMVHIFLGDGRRIKYLALTPKRQHITVTAIGPDVKRTDAVERMRQDDMAPFLPAGWTFCCHCHPAFPVSMATKPYSDRAVVIGDACVSRYLKNGIESAYYTAHFAVKTIVERGLAKRDFRRHYIRACWARYGWDNWFGKVLFLLNDVLCYFPILANAHIRAVRAEQAHLPARKRRHSQILWDVFTGDRPYAKILLNSIHPMLHVRTAPELLREIWSALTLRT